MLRKFLREVEQAGLRVPASTSLVSPGEVDGLPEPARRYMAFMGVVGRPRVWSFRAHFRGRFRPGAQAGWLPCEAWQYNDALDVARIFHLRLGMYGVIPVLARDTCLAGQGRMLVRGLDWITLQDARGPALDEGELVTYLNDAVLFAPSQLLAPNASLTAVDDGSFDVSLTDRGRTVGARVYVDPEGAPRTSRPRTASTWRRTARRSARAGARRSKGGTVGAIAPAPAARRRSGTCPTARCLMPISGSCRAASWRTSRRAAELPELVRPATQVRGRAG